MTLRHVAWIFALGALACSSDDPPKKAPVCTVKPVEDCPSPAPTYADVVPIFDAKCNGCHSDASSGPWPLTDYDSVEAWWDLIRRDTLNCSMPPADSGLVLTSDESTLILTWIACDLPK